METFQRPESLCTLPQEILSMVFDILLSEQRLCSLASVASVCRDVGSAAKRALYRAPRVYGIRALVPFLRTLGARPDLARYVVELKIDDFDNNCALL
jgi:hypothetical protein